MKVQFKYYLHDNSSSYERCEYIMAQIKQEHPEFEMDEDDFNDLIGKPFYEVDLTCELDTDTGQVKIIEATA